MFARGGMRFARGYFWQWDEPPPPALFSIVRSWLGENGLLGYVWRSHIF